MDGSEKFPDFPASPPTADARLDLARSVLRRYNELDSPGVLPCREGTASLLPLPFQEDGRKRREG
jgi:hypothetical protein